jgi:hypothetical protein
VASTAIDTLLATARRDVALVVVGGRPIVGNDGYRRLFAARGSQPRPLCVDGVEKLADADLAARIAACAIAEPGVSLS